MQERYAVRQPSRKWHISEWRDVGGVRRIFMALRDADSLHEVSDLWEYLEFLKSSLNKTWQSHAWDLT